MIKATDYFPKAPRPGPEPVWIRSCLSIVVGVALFWWSMKLRQPEPPAGAELTELAMSYVHYIPGFVAVVCLLYGSIFLRESYHRSIWRSSRIEAVLIDDFRFARLKSGAAGVATGLLASHSPLHLMTSGGAEMIALRIRGRKVKKLRLRVAHYHFDPDNIPEATWVITPRAGWMAYLLANVAPKEWSKFAAPDEVAEQLKEELAAARTRKKNRIAETSDETRQHLQRKYD
ncbi:MAG: hypothetical protein KDB90_08260 [Planctomycetes bacterium]|nr:hypothetical protein [Planctomycetota bacterium]